MKSSGSVWISCGECGHTTRALAVMARRVLATRNGCERCGSLSAPVMQATASGAHVARPEWEAFPMGLREEGMFTTFTFPTKTPVQRWAQGFTSRWKARLS